MLLGPPAGYRDTQSHADRQGEIFMIVGSILLKDSNEESDEN
jgi:hypothetical protein